MARYVLPAFYLIVDSSAWIERLVPCGVKLVQLRIKEHDAAHVRAEIVRSKEICERHGAQLIVNDYWDLALETGCDFVHLGQEDLVGADVTALRKAGVRIGVSTHDDAELDQALTVEPDYVALGPIFPTILKKMPWAPQGLGKIRIWQKKIGEIPLVAIGGLTIDRAPGVIEAGADSLAVVTDISLNADPEGRTRQWLAITSRVYA